MRWAAYVQGHRLGHRTTISATVLPHGRHVFGMQTEPTPAPAAGLRGSTPAGAVCGGDRRGRRRHRSAAPVCGGARQRGRFAGETAAPACGGARQRGRSAGETAGVIGGGDGGTGRPHRPVRGVRSRARSSRSGDRRPTGRVRRVESGRPPAWGPSSARDSRHSSTTTSISQAIEPRPIRSTEASSCSRRLGPPPAAAAVYEDSLGVGQVDPGS